LHLQPRPFQPFHCDFPVSERLNFRLPYLLREKGVPNNPVHGCASVSLLIESEGSISNSHRGNFDIIADILDASYGGAKKTNLMYRCNLSFKQLKCYSRFLLENGLLRLNSRASIAETATFEVTEKGREFLKAYRGLKALMK
jgi:predicted transcriptional regulator